MSNEVSTMTDFFDDVYMKSNGTAGTKKIVQNKNYQRVKGGPYGLLEPFQVTWKDLTYKVPTKLFRPKKTILNNVSGYFRSGHITAVMGPSGSGKSSLLGCISGQKKTGVSGSITISTGRQVKFAFIAQEDYLLGKLKIRESLIYASKLKNGGRVDHQLVVDNVINRLRIDDCANNRPARCSGGQKKRISIALELVSKPNILILDEPTSGLDTVTTWQLISTLNELTKQTEPVAIIATIHQPSARLFNLFNAVYIMSYDGQCIYHGPPQRMLGLLSQYGLNCPKFHNPSDFILEVASNEHGIGKVMMLACLMRIEALDLKAHNNPIKPYHKFRTLSHIWILTRRTFKLTIRDPFMVPIRTIGHILVAILIVILWGSESGKLSGCPEDFVVKGGTYVENYGRVSDKLNENTAGIYFLLLFIWFGSIFAVLLTFPQEMNIFLKEYSNGWYSCFSYYMSKVLCDIPFQLTIPNLISIPVYIMTGQNYKEEWRLYHFMGIAILIALTASSQGLMISAWLMKYPGPAAFIGTVSGFPMFLFSGYMLPINEMPDYFRWISWGNFMRFGLESSVVDIYGYDRCGETSHMVHNKTDWTKVIPMSAMMEIYNSEVINTNALVSTLNFFSGEVSNQTQSIALVKFGYTDSNLYEGIAMLLLIMTAYKILTYFFLWKKVRAIN